MCLTVITKRYKKPSDRIVEAWKQFTVCHDGSVVTSVCHFPIQYGQWIRAVATKAEEYPTGFHAYASRQKLMSSWLYGEEWDHLQDITLKVRLRGIETVGTESGAKVYVAREMFIPEPKGKKAK